MKPFISVILPNFNELENLKRGVLSSIAGYLKTQPYLWEVIISDDGSTDQSVKYVRDFIKKNHEFRLIINRHAGKPFALRSAIAKARGQYVLFTDMDQSTPISELSKLVPFTTNGYKVVIGSRGRGRDAAFHRQIISIGFWFIRKSIILSEIKDTQCGFKLIDTDLAKNIFEKMRIFGRKNHASGWTVTAYDVEMLHIVKKFGEKIKEVRVIWKDEDTSVGKGRNFIKESYEMLFEIMRVKINDFLGKYNV